MITLQEESPSTFLGEFVGKRKQALLAALDSFICCSSKAREMVFTVAHDHSSVAYSVESKSCVVR